MPRASVGQQMAPAGTIPAGGDATGPGPDRSPRDEVLLETLTRQARVMESLSAGETDTPEAAELAWLGVQHQADRYLRSLDARAWARASERWGERLASHRRMLEDYHGEAGRRLAEARPGAAGAAGQRVGLRVAVIGKGGAGKSLVSGTLSRVLARRGRRVLAADLDTNPGLAFSLGVAPCSGGLPDRVVEPHAGAPYGWRLRSGVSPAQVVDRFTTPAPDGVRFLALGKIDEPDKASSKRTVAALLEVLLGFADPSWDVIGDLEAGPTTPFERYHAFADRVLVVVGPAWRSAMTARRLLPLVGEVPTTVVGNRFGHEPDHPGLDPVVRIPFDPAVADAERRGLAPLDACPSSVAVAAIERLADLLVAGQAPA